MECAVDLAVLGHRLVRLAHRWEWAQTFGVPMLGIRQLEKWVRAPDSKNLDLHWWHEHRVDSQLHETGAGLVVAYFTGAQETAAVQCLVWCLPP
jgi:hypothetical protein